MSATSESGPSGETANSLRRHGGPLSGGLGVVVFVILITSAGYLSYKALTTAEQAPPEPMPGPFVCARTGKPFEYAMRMGERWPVDSPFSREKTGYPAEACYWTKDGRRRRTPTYVILQEVLGKSGDTVCPECGRLVLPHNPQPPEGTPYADEAATPSTGPSAGPGS